MLNQVGLIAQIFLQEWRSTTKTFMLSLDPYSWVRSCQHHPAAQESFPKNVSSQLKEC